ncbi:MAG: formate dehydrogenase accessory protein FdhE [Deltaproteobacteria bacterium]|nr:formate dehydrogenase accessory protein FdhE [Deltaproteobacteria bacterium]
MRKAECTHRDLGELLKFYEKLCQAQFAFKAELEEYDNSGHLKEINPTYLAEGSPQLTFDELKMGATPFMPLFRNLVDLLNKYTVFPPSCAAGPRPDTILEYAREIFASRGSLAISGQPADLFRTAAGFTLGPYLQRACESIMPRIEASLWHRGFCPVCGGWPCFAALNVEFDSPRTLLCSRCNGEWSYRRVGCPFCGGNHPQIYYPSEDGKYRLYVCDNCSRYLKTVDLRETGPDICLPAECIVTVSMDLAVQEKRDKAY